MVMKHYFQYILFAITIIAQQTKSHAQQLISDSLVITYSQEELTEMMSLPIVQYGVEAYKINYLTNDINGNESIASGLIVIPSNNDCPWSLTTYLHGTVSHKENVPSRLSYEAQIGYYAASIIGSVVALPDYLGLGDSPGFHPYIHSDSEASASLDMLKATREFCENHNIALNDDLFLFGYSQGGHSTLALQKLIEEEYNEEFTITSSIPMAGPYDVSGVQTDLLTDGDDYPSPFYLPYIVLSYYTIYAELGSYAYDSLFVSPYDSLLPIYFDGYHGAGEIDAIMPTNPVEVLNPNFYESFLSDSVHPFRAALIDNDLVNWEPISPINFYYCSGDEHVTYLNAIVASESMSEFEETSIEQTEIGETLNHYECAEPAITQAILNFLLLSTPCNTNIINHESSQIQIHPNPASDFINVSLGAYQNCSIVLSDYTGRILLAENVKQNNYQIDINNIIQGLYYLQFYSNHKLVSTKKLIIN